MTSRPTDEQSLTAAVNTLALTWWQPRTGNERQSFGGQKGDLLRELARYAALIEPAPSPVHLFAAAAVIRRDFGPWGGTSKERVTAGTAPQIQKEAEAIEAAVVRLVR